VTTKRKPVGRPLRQKITPEILATFRTMQELESACSCESIDWTDRNYTKHRPCAACDEWWGRHAILHRSLNLKPWEWPAVENPDALNPYPEGSQAAQDHKPDLRGRELYRALEKAAEGLTA
jgi:hypothetical protein